MRRLSKQLGNWLSKLLPLVVVLAVGAIVARAARDPLKLSSPKAWATPPASDISPVVARVDELFEQRWSEAGLVPAVPAEPLQVLRRLSLALHGTIPSLEEIREFEADDRPDRLERWTARMLADRRFADYFAERLARGFVGKEVRQFIVFRRDRFVRWLSEQIQKNTPYDQIVRTMITSTGLWTDRPETNFVSAAKNEDDLDENKLAGRTVRAFLGQRIDCAQCHDHPFDHWKQADFEGLAALYGQVQVNLLGVEDKSRDKKGEPIEYTVEDRQTLAERDVPARVPFCEENLPDDGTRRERLAAWVTHGENRRFDRAIANRVWALLFGRAWHEPVDDLGDPSEDQRDVLDELGTDFRAHGCDLRRMIQVVAASKPFRLTSEWPPPRDEQPAEGGSLVELALAPVGLLAAAARGAFAPTGERLLSPEDAALDALHRAESAWAVFPLVRLRPEQVIGSIRQSVSIQTADADSHWVFRTVRLLQEGEFVRDYGDLGENELHDRGGTIPQRLLMLNGKLAGEAAQGGAINAAGRIAAMASTDAKCIETAYLVCLSRRPGAAEQAHFERRLAGTSGDKRKHTVEDLIWSLFNSTEFSWNH